MALLLLLLLLPGALVAVLLIGNDVIGGERDDGGGTAEHGEQVCRRGSTVEVKYSCGAGRRFVWVVVLEIRMGLDLC